MANKYARTAGGNWNADETWSTTSGGGADTTAPTSSDDVFFDANSGNVTLNASGNAKSINCTGYTGTITHNNNVTLTIAGNLTFVSGMTYTHGNPTCTIVISTTATVTTGGKNLIRLNITGGTTTLGDNYTGSNTSTAVLNMNVGASLNLNGNTVSGNSATNRLLIASNTVGSAVTITIASGTFANVDFRDITADVVTDVSAITGLSGDCGGNTNFTFTTAATQTWSGTSGGNWSDNAWTTRMPLPQDNVVINAAFSASQTITVNVNRIGKNIDFTGATGTPTLALTQSGQELYGSLTLISGMTISQNQTLTFLGRSNSTLTTAGNTLSALTINMASGTLTLQDALTLSSQLILTLGTLDSNNFNITTTIFSSTSSNVRSLTLGSSSLTLTSTGTVWNTGTSTNLTLSVENSTIALTDTSASSKTFAGGEKTFGNIAITGGGSGAVIFTGANTFNRITVIGGTKSITLPGSTTTTILSGLGLGNSTNLITFTASSGSATIAKSSGVVSWNYVSLTNIPASGSAKFYAGANSTDGGGNTNWIFKNAPSGSGQFTGGGRFGRGSFGRAKFGTAGFYR